MRLWVDPWKTPTPDPFRELEFLCHAIVVGLRERHAVAEPEQDVALDLVLIGPEQLDPRVRRSGVAVGDEVGVKLHGLGLDEQDPEVAVVRQPDPGDAALGGAAQEDAAGEPRDRAVEDPYPAVSVGEDSGG